MTDYISRRSVMELVQFMPAKGGPIGMVPTKAVLRIPAADVRPVVRGKWELIERRIISKVQIWKCSNCGNMLEVRETTFNCGRGDCNFCPNCGAEMREGKQK